MATHKLAVILRNPADDAQFLLTRAPRPPLFGDQDYDSYADSDLWDLPSAAQLCALTGDGTESQMAVQGAELCSEKIVLGRFDLNSGLHSALGQAGLGLADVAEWRFFKYVPEAEFGPGAAINVVFIEGKLLGQGKILESCNWVSAGSCMDLLVNVKPGSDRVGPLAVLGPLNQLLPQANFQVPSTLGYQEFPPGVMVVPMGSRTAKPFCTTNLVVFAPKIHSGECEDGNFFASGDALMVDPGCRSEFREELWQIAASLPRKLIVFVTHHHHDHVAGLSIIQKCNPDAMLVVHKNTMAFIKKDDWSLGYKLVSGAEEISIGGQRLTIIFAPGHTDGHMALLHHSSNSLIVGDHCLGQGSAILDINSGGNIADYYKSTYKFMELSPHVLIPMHGRVNLWPKHMLCGYLRNRRTREASVLRAIEGGAESLFDIVSTVYAGVDCSYWYLASWNVRVHVEHLAQLDKLPKGFSIESFNRSLDSFAAELDKI